MKYEKVIHENKNDQGREMSFLRRVTAVAAGTFVVGVFGRSY